ncbi:Transcription initiation factor TFIID subunit 12 [Pleurotus ostreatus]|uniref:TBP-associated factor 12 n=1 Tax=Pleurotus ostreatus TaxID=5322 RepID=A0A8H6ZT76_PLEOS|nr:Transcription initiation factor TFIID subunit 12 [Pleurotus ostreatus]KAF7428016.1 Transcription initiation factor TFIID subunit 12 [Pleurotus ostreatus]
MSTPNAGQAASSPAPSTSAQPTQPQINTANAINIVNALSSLLKNKTGETVANEQITQALISNMSYLHELAKNGKLDQNQILQLKAYADQNRVKPPAAATSASSPAPAHPSTPAPTAQPGAFKNPTDAPPLTLSSTVGEGYTISSTLSTTNPGPVAWASAQQGRPTLTGGIAGGRMAGTPAQIARTPDDPTLLTVDEHRNRRKTTPGDQSMRRSIQDLVASIDPNVKIEPEVEDLLLNIADEFIDSVTTFACRLAKHRGCDTLEVRDLQLHLERNHNIRIPGFASDETRLSLSQSGVAPAPAASLKKGAQGPNTGLRAHRNAQVNQAKREAKMS